MSKLYELSEQFKNLEALLENEDLPKEEIEQALNSVQADLNDKIESMSKYIKNLESDVVVIASEVKRLSEKKKHKENTINSIKAYMFEQLKHLDMKSVKTTLFNVTIQNNPPSVNVLDETKIPKKYFIKQLPVLDKKTLLADLKLNAKIKGCEIKQSESLRIK